MTTPPVSIVDIALAAKRANLELVSCKHQEFLDASVSFRNGTITKDQFDNVVRDFTRAVFDYEHSITAYNAILDHHPI